MNTRDLITRADELMRNTDALSREVTADDGTTFRMLRHHGFFGGPLATDKAKNFLRALFRQHAGHPDAEAIRAMFNAMREDGDRITRADVSAGIEVLTKL